MTRLLLTLTLAFALFAVGYALGKRRVPVSPCPEYKVYDGQAVSELTERANERKAIKGLST